MPTQRELLSAAAGLAPILASSAGAMASLAFFRPWVELTLGPGGTSATMSGGTLARQAIYSVPWIYVTPAAIVLIIVLAAILLFSRQRRIKIGVGLGLALLAVPSLAWPIAALARFVHNVAQFNASGLPSHIALTKWWWLYSASLAVVFVSGIIQIAAATQRESPAAPQL